MGAGPSDRLTLTGPSGPGSRMAKPGPKPSGVQSRRLHLTPEAIRRLDAHAALMTRTTGREHSRSQAAEVLLRGLPDAPVKGAAVEAKAADPFGEQMRAETERDAALELP